MNSKDAIRQGVLEENQRKINSAISICMMLADYSRKHECEGCAVATYTACIADGVADLLCSIENVTYEPND